MKPILIALTVLTLSFGSALAAPFGSEAGLYRDLARWHNAAAAPHVASYPSASLTEVVDGYWATLSALGYGGVATAMTPATTRYTFAGAAGVLEAAFTQTDEAVVVTLLGVPEASYASAPD